MQVRRGGRGFGRSDRVHVRFHVSNAANCVRHGARRTHIQVGGGDILCGTATLRTLWDTMQSLTPCCRTMSQVWPTTGTPVRATFISGLAAALAALLIQLEVLVEMMSIGKTTLRGVFMPVLIRFHSSGGSLPPLLKQTNLCLVKSPFGSDQ